MKASQKNWQQPIMDCYPNLFKEINHIDCNSGWSKIIECLCFSIQNHINELPEEFQDQLFFLSIKEKFGELRVYMSHETPFITGAIDVVSLLSSSICEICGNPGQLSFISNYYSTLCDSHLEKINE